MWWSRDGHYRDIYRHDIASAADSSIHAAAWTAMTCLIAHWIINAHANYKQEYNSLITDNNSIAFASWMRHKLSVVLWNNIYNT